MSSQQRILQLCAPYLVHAVPPNFATYIEPHARSDSFFRYLEASHIIQGHPSLLLADTPMTTPLAAMVTTGNPYQVIALSEAHDLVFFSRPDSGLRLADVRDLTHALSAKGCYVMIAPVSRRHFNFYFSAYLATPILGKWLMVTNWDPDLFA